MTQATLPPPAPTPRTSTDGRRIGIASAIWGGSILLSRVIGLVREGVLGRTLGASAEGDLYTTAFVVPDFLNYLLAGGALSIVFIPIFGAYLARGEEERASEAFSVLANALILALGCATVALWFALPALAPLVAPGFTVEQRAELVALTRIVLPAQAFHVVGGLLSASMQARDRHALPALAPLVYTLGIIAGGVIGGPEHGARGFAWGALAGSALGPFLLPYLGARRAGLRWRARLSLRHPDLKTYLARSVPIMLGFSIVIVDDWYLKREGTVLGAGAAATLTYAKTLMKVPIGVFGLAAGVAVFPTLQRLVAEGRTDEMAGTLGRALRNLLVISCAAQTVLVVASEDVVALVYGRSRLAPEDLRALGACLALVSLGLGAWSTQALLARGFYALGNTWLPALLGTSVAIAAYPLYVVARESLGMEGLAWASTAAIAVYTVTLAWAWGRLLARRGVARGAVGPFLARAAVATAAATGAGRLVGRYAWNPTSTGEIALRAGVTAVVALATFGIVAKLVGLREVEDLARALLRRPARAPSHGR